MPIPDCAGGVEISRATVVRVEKNGALILNDGRAMLLEGIRLPKRGPAADAALTELRALAMAGPLKMTSTPPKEDRYDRVRVQAFGNVWLQMEMLRRGLARVSIAPDRNECAPDFYEAEQQARAAGRGIWANPAYAVRRPDSFSNNDLGSFQLVEGVVTNESRRDGQAVLELGPRFVAVIGADDARAFRDIDPPLENLKGRRIRVRGIIQATNDGRAGLALSNPEQIELVH